MSGHENKHEATAARAQSPLPQPKATKTKTARRVTSPATAINQHIAAAVIRLTVDSCLESSKFSRICRYAGTSESKGLAVLRQYILDLRAAASASQACGGMMSYSRRAF
jgi:hypothetical protein